MFEGLEGAEPAVVSHAGRTPSRPAEFVIDHESGFDALAALRIHARAENVAAAHKVLTLAAFARRAFEDDLDRFGEDIALERGGRGAESEAALALGLSFSLAGKYVAVGNNLDHHLPLTRAAFLDGRLDYPRVRTISEFTDQVSDATLEALEPLAVDAALQRPPRALAAEIMRQLIRINPDEAARLRKRRERNSRFISVSADRHGMATLFGTLTAAEGQAVAGLIEEMGGTVCAADPRTPDNLRTDAGGTSLHEVLGGSWR
ncbi:DUF222 domain-containing protein [Rhodococcus kronopolitis]|uniref:DUF222 domain-containing protein n=1 Tax=Rhodococcus kronopolitis TaxID=1460226 RepID=A0ABV9FRQ9_9NOCA